MPHEKTSNSRPFSGRIDPTNASPIVRSLCKRGVCLSTPELKGIHAQQTIRRVWCVAKEHIATSYRGCGTQLPDHRMDVRRCFSTPTRAKWSTSRQRSQLGRIQHVLMYSHGRTLKYLVADLSTGNIGRIIISW
jgi:hypothetical protein